MILVPLLLYFLLLLHLISDSTSSSTTAMDHRKNKNISTINIPKREHGYGQFDFSTKIITSQEELDDLLHDVEIGMRWNDKKSFLDVMLNTKVNFKQSNIILIKHVEGSGSISVKATIKAEDRGTDVLVIIDRIVPSLQTADMAFYCFAYVIPKNAGNSVVELRGHNHGGDKVIYAVEYDMC